MILDTAALVRVIRREGTPALPKYIHASQPGGRVSAPAVLRIAITFKARRISGRVQSTVLLIKSDRIEIKGRPCRIGS
jgi:hypothetical protein